MEITDVPVRFSHDYSIDNLRKSPQFWEKVQGDRQLFFDIDSLLCRPCNDEVLSYDFIGAPVNIMGRGRRVIQGYDGGLCLRNRSAMLDVCRQYDTDESVPEDVYFSVNMQHDHGRYRLPSADLARKYFVRDQFADKPLCLHRPWQYLSISEVRQMLAAIEY